MTETPDKVSKVIRFKIRAHRKLGDLLDRFQLLKWGDPPDYRPGDLEKITAEISHLLAIESCCTPPPTQGVQ